MLEHIPGFKRRRDSSAQTLLNVTCKLCYNFLTIPTYQCSQDHFICISCYSYMSSPKSCLLCSHHNTHLTRSISIEQHLEHYYTSCKYSPEGCIMYDTLPTIQDHEQVCLFIPTVKCPVRCTGFTPCRWQGKLNSILDHVLNAHKVSIQAFNSDKAGISLDDTIHNFESNSQHVVSMVLNIRSGYVYVEMNRLLYDYAILVVPLDMNRTMSQVRIEFIEDNERVCYSRRFLRNFKDGLEEAICIVCDSMMRKYCSKCITYILEVN